MNRNVQRTENVNSAMSEFDQLSMQGSTVQQPAANVGMDDFINGGGSVPTPTRPQVGNNTANDSMFRPSESAVKKQRFKADKKPKLTTEKPKIKVNPIKIIVPIAVIGVAAGVCIGVRPINMTIKTLGGANGFYLAAEGNTLKTDINDFKGIVTNFPSLATDNAIKGDLKVTLSSVGAEKFFNEKITGVYEGEYTFSFGDDNILKYDYSKDGMPVGEAALQYASKDGSLDINPSFSDNVLRVEVETLSEEFQNLGIDIDGKTVRQAMKDFDAFKPSVLVNLMTDEDIDKTIDSVLAPYTEALGKMEFKSSYIATPSIGDPDIKAVEGYKITATWESVKTLVDSWIMVAKADKTLIQSFTSLGYSEQAYLDKLNDVSAWVNSAYNSCSPDAVCEMDVYVNSDNKIEYRTITLPTSDSTSATIYLTDSNSKRSVFLEEGAIIKGAELKYVKAENGAYTGTLQITDGVTTKKMDFENLIVGDTLSGKIAITDGVYSTTMNITAAGTEHVALSCSENNQNLFNLDMTYQTYAVTDIEDIKGKSNCDLYGDRGCEALFEDADMRNIIAILNNNGIDYVIDAEKLGQHYANILNSWGTKAYDYNEEPDLEAINEEEVLREAIVNANDQASVLYTAINRFIVDVINNGGTVANGVYCGYVTEKDNSLNFENVFDEKNLKMCVGANVDPGYYCIVVKDRQVAYTFWSATEDFSERVKNKDLPTHFKSFENIEEVKGSFPNPSGTGE